MEEVWKSPKVEGEDEANEAGAGDYVEGKEDGIFEGCKEEDEKEGELEGDRGEGGEE